MKLVTQASIPDEEVFEKPDTPEDNLPEGKQKILNLVTKTKKLEPIVSFTKLLKHQMYLKAEIIEQPAIIISNPKLRFKTCSIRAESALIAM